MLHWLINVLIGIKVGLCSCTPEVHRLGVRRVRSDYRIERLGAAPAYRLPAVVNESSGLARRTTTSVWTHNDGGGRPTLYAISTTKAGTSTLPGTLLDSLPLPQLRNVDWEDLARQDSSRQGDARLFIGDLGNNFNNRRDLAIYIVDPKRVTSPETIRLRYADQTEFPARKRNFDCEAVFFRSDSLFLLSKNRSGHIVRLYGLPAQAGDYVLNPLDSVFIKSMVTGATLSPDAKTLAILTYGKVLFFDLTSPVSTRLNRPAACLRLPRGQAEGIVFMADNELLITNERGRMYRVTRR
ncbi:hypothetical protein [Fibrella forsythiae]|uniref:Uncharacterized protein n=1 Tax=Fibrella forsythiae TaxID=2817061 RepID=A0ABS3JRZ2_9BACT|nr:hypothetical protein [Fibrella forsythiae]MBO0951974.1 hypothetical protein [Fibrella forsythiae]